MQSLLRLSYVEVEDWITKRLRNGVLCYVKREGANGKEKRNPRQRLIEELRQRLRRTYLVEVIQPKAAQYPKAAIRF